MNSSDFHTLDVRYMSTEKEWFDIMIQKQILVCHAPRPICFSYACHMFYCTYKALGYHIQRLIIPQPVYLSDCLTLSRYLEPSSGVTVMLI